MVAELEPDVDSIVDEPGVVAELEPGVDSTLDVPGVVAELEPGVVAELGTWCGANIRTDSYSGFVTISTSRNRNPT